MVSKTDEIVIIDDIEAIGEMVKEQLEMMGFLKIESFSDPFKAIEAIKRKNKSPVIITDYEIPQKNGLQIISEARNYHPGIKAVVITQDPKEVFKKSNKYEVIEKDKNMFEHLMIWFKEC
jgi:DNA-binding NtrC family response regulator